MIAAIKAPFIDWSALAPYTSLTVGAVVVLIAGLVGSARLRSWLVPGLALVTLAITAVELLSRWNHPKVIISEALRVDNLTVTLGLLCVGAAAFAVILSLRSDTEEGVGRGEYHSLLLFTTIGMLILIAANDLVTIFAGLELLSIPLYVLCATELRREHSLEAGLKYLIVGSVGSATLLYGLALIYGATGSTSLPKIGVAITNTGALTDPLLLAGTALAIAGLSFKASAAPFHQWTPDVYEGAPTPVTTFMATATKAAALGILLRLLVGPLLPAVDDWAPVIAIIATLSIVVGNFGALGQDSLKRMLAWSSVAQVGYLLAGLVVATSLGIGALVFYLVVYAVMTLAAFAVVVENERTSDDGERLSGFAGLGRRRPWLAGAMTVSMLSLAGLPPTGGFIGKLAIINADASGGWMWLAIVLVLGSLVSLGYYLRVIATMWMTEGSAEKTPVVKQAREIVAVALLAAAVTIAAGVLPSWPLERAQDVGQTVISSR
jgi:NADH-quinone oxidoreductase subunit N